MAETNGNMTQDTTLDDVQINQATMKVYGTNEPYIGRTVTIAGFEYTTVGGALEGDSFQLVPIDEGQTNVPLEEQTPIGSALNVGGGESTVVDNNPVVNLFQAPSTPRYRREDNNQLVPIGANLHEHQDGTIMTEHSMGPNDNSVVVYQDISQDTTIDDNQQNGGENGNTPPPDITPPPPGNGGGNGMNQGGGNY